MMKKEKNLELFKIIDPDACMYFSNLSNRDLKDLLFLINDYALRLRDSLNLDENITFGLELEFENAIKKSINKNIKKEVSLENWCIKDDSSLHKGLEINSPVLIDKRENWQALDLVCKILKNRSCISNNSGGHIHIGSQIIGSNKNDLLHFLKIWATYENIIYRFGYGEFLTPRKTTEKYASPISPLIFNQLDNLRSINYLSLNALSQSKYQAINFKHIENFNTFAFANTIEFRCPNGTLNPVVWQNNVNLFTKLLLYCKSKQYNLDIIDKRYEEVKMGINFSMYNEIFLNQALELCDLIFDNNLDKIYFLRQYLKSFETKHNYLVKAKKFTIKK